MTALPCTDCTVPHTSDCTTVTGLYCTAWAMPDMQPAHPHGCCLCCNDCTAATALHCLCCTALSHYNLSTTPPAPHCTALRVCNGPHCYALANTAGASPTAAPQMTYYYTYCSKRSSYPLQPLQPAADLNNHDSTASDLVSDVLKKLGSWTPMILIWRQTSYRCTTRSNTMEPHRDLNSAPSTPVQAG